MNARARHGGFTLIELLVVMGILSGFLVMLVQFVDAGVRLFDEGESGQALADRASAAQTAVERELRALRGADLGIEAAPPQSRLLAQLLPLGLPARSLPGDPRGIVLRASVELEPQEEERLLADELLLRAARELGDQPDPQAVAERAEQLRTATALRGRGRLWLQSWPRSADGALLELRFARFLPDSVLDLGRDQPVDPFQVPVPGGAELPALVVHAATEVLVDDLLHFELAFWSQTTRGFERSGAEGPESVWDSARAGWLADPALGPVFRLDLGPGSLEDPTDDVWPRAVQVTLVVARSAREPLEGLLTDDLEPAAQTLELVDGERFPGALDGGWAKVGGEWLRYQQRDGDLLRGLVRGQRGTSARKHEAGTAVRVGRTVRFTVQLAPGRDDWNGWRNG
jgi:prepilin-type N-terminal cleavage/methylation domain-containing protein